MSGIGVRNGCNAHFHVTTVSITGFPYQFGQKRRFGRSDKSVCPVCRKLPEVLGGGVPLGYSRGSWCVLRVPEKSMFGRTNNVGLDMFSRYPGAYSLGRGAAGLWPLVRLWPAEPWLQLLCSGIMAGCGWLLLAIVGCCCPLEADGWLGRLGRPGACRWQSSAGLDVAESSCGWPRTAVG